MINNGSATLIFAAVLAAPPLGIAELWAASASKEAPSVQTSADQSALFPIFKNGKWGYITAEGKIAIPPRYHHADLFHEDVARVGLGDALNASANMDESLVNINNGMASYLIDRKPVPIISNLGFIDRTGKTVIPAGKFEMLEPFHDGLARAWLDQKVGFIDKTGNVVISFAFEEAQDFFDGRAAVKSDGKWGYIDVKGGLSIKPVFEAATRFSHGLALTRKSGTWTAIDPTGKVKIELPSTFVEPEYFRGHVPFSGGLERIRIRDKKKEKTVGTNYISYQFIGIDGKIMQGIQPGKIYEARPFSEGLSAVTDSESRYSEGRKWGFIDGTGKFAIAPRFDEARGFSDGLAAVRMGGTWNPELRRYDNAKWGYIDKTDKIVIEAKYDDANDFMTGAAHVIDGGKDAYIDKSGESIWSE